MQIKKIVTTTLLSITLLGLGACGHTDFDRGMGGAMVGSATGAAVGAVTGMTIAQGAVLGAAGGAVVGLATDSDQINLGKPFWKKQTSQQHYKAQNSSVRSIQSGLTAKGYNPGPIDGVMGNKTRRAIRAYQRDNGLLVNGYASQQLASHIQRH